MARFLAFAAVVAVVWRFCFPFLIFGAGAAAGIGADRVYRDHYTGKIVNHVYSPADYEVNVVPQNQYLGVDVNYAEAQAVGGSKPRAKKK